ncbi:hypothetical protein KUCAC02_029086 [Chaenocephalus aceratus]|uniref:Uncharacterized protein n=1 Tax=Chaenocephalus aceratus TaxID=36190 RepID=A0ACB9X4X4_CHAAC|nr:hypothetical protein KUCAC02_029086 [Chaenocephalus aceratus]
MAAYHRGLSPSSSTNLEPAVANPQSLPSVNCSYGNLSIEQPIPVELLQGPSSTSVADNQPGDSELEGQGQVVVPKVGSTRPWITAVNYTGERWDEPDPPPPALLPCVRAIAIRDTSEAAPSAGCRTHGTIWHLCCPSGDSPSLVYTTTSEKKRPPEVTLPSVDVYYSIIPMEGSRSSVSFHRNEPWRGQSANTGPLGLGLGGQWSLGEDVSLQDMLKAGSVAMTFGMVSAKGEKLRLDENVEVLVPPSPVRLGKTVAFGVYMKTGSNTEQFTLR